MTCPDCTEDVPSCDNIEVEDVSNKEKLFSYLFFSFMFLTLISLMYFDIIRISHPFL